VQGLTVRQLEAFVVTAEELHFGRASVRLEISQPSLSQLIGRIEETVGAELFQRRPRVRLTEAGLLLLPQVRGALQALERGVASVAELATGVAGTLTIRFTSSALVSPFPRILRRFRSRFPAIRVDLQKSSSASIAADLDVDEIGIARHPPHDLPPVFTSLVDEPFVLALPPEHPFVSRSCIALEALADEPFVHFPRHEAPALHEEIRRSCLAAGFELTVVLEATEWLTIVGLVRSGPGVAFVPASFQTLKWGGVEYRPLGPGAPTSSVVVRHRPHSTSPAVKHFMDVVRDVGEEPRR